MSTGPDWAIIEAAYRAGARSLRQIAAEQEITEGAIRARAKKAGWPRGTTQAITQPEPEAARLETDSALTRMAALEAQVADLAAQLEEAGELLKGLVKANADAFRSRGPLYPWLLPARRPTRWG